MATTQTISFVESDATVRTVGIGREESELTQALRPAVKLAAETRKTYTLPFKWNAKGELSKEGQQMVSTIQRLAREFKVSVRIGSDSKDGKKVSGSNAIFCAVDQITRRPLTDEQKAARAAKRAANKATAAKKVASKR